MRIIFVILLLTSSGLAGDTEEALKKIAEASYEYPAVKGRVKDIERRYVPELVKEYGPWITRIVRATQEQAISYTWKF